MDALQHQDGENSDQTAAAQEEANTLIVECILSLLIEEEVASSIRKPRISLGNNPVTLSAMTMLLILKFTSRLSILQVVPDISGPEKRLYDVPRSRRYPYLPPSVSIFTPVGIHIYPQSIPRRYPQYIV
ncbi:hypothetical protein E4U37_007661 [Claviceps purpurea]|nr:hypothetical protein E4U37_007661 [Claviceps purpurea]